MLLSSVASRLVVDPRKFVDYALNPESPSGRHKAIVFARVLGFTRENYADLMRQIEQLALEGEVDFHSEDGFGRRYTVDLPIRGTEGREAMVRTGWLVPWDVDEARLLTLYVRR